MAYLSWFPRVINLIVRVFKAFRNLLRRIAANLFGTDLSNSEFQKSLLPEYGNIQNFLKQFKTHGLRPFFIKMERKDEFISILRLICPGAEEIIVNRADKICEHYFDLLGSGPVQLGWPIDWHTDFKSGFRWNPLLHHTEIRPASYPGGYDLKVPWELSRCQHFPWLGQAYWLTGDEKYAREFRAEVEDWITQNTPEFGVNWACSMDIAIRAVSWLWGYAFFQASPVLDDDFKVTFCKSLLCHGRHIMANLERTFTFSGNHYLSDIVGLIYLGMLLPEFKESKTWREFGLKELETEMFKQVYPDGGDFEASTSYHRLATELFLSATLLARLNGHNFSEKFMERLEKMLEFIYQITKPDGTIPLIGDQDNGRLHRLKVWNDESLEWKNFQPILAIGCILFENMKWGKAADLHWEEAIWFFGTEALLAYKECIRNPYVQMQSTGFEDTGLYIMRSDDIYAAIDLGPVGQNGYGGHAHNDTLSFELSASGQTWIQDSGTYVYTSDYKARNLFRSTGFHNTLTFPDYEQNHFDARSLFRLKNESNSRLLSWYTESDYTYFRGEFQRTKYPKLIHHRSFFLDRKERALVITDWCTEEVGQFVIHISPGLRLEKVEKPSLGIKLINLAEESALVLSVSSESTKMEISDSWISESYGVRNLSKTIFFEQPADNNHKIVIIFPGKNHMIVNRVRNVLNHEIIFLEKHHLNESDKG